MVTLQTVEVPGLRDALKRERVLRDRAFLGGEEIVCGVVVRQLSLRIALFLEHAENGFFIPFHFDDDNEVAAHALQVLWFSKPDWEEPRLEADGFVMSWFEAYKRFRFQKRFLLQNDIETLVSEVRAWIDDAMLDCPKGGHSSGPSQSYASYPAHLVDLFAAAGLPFSYAEILDMPLKRLWQHWRLASNRLYDVKLTNPSDDLTVKHIAKAPS